MTTAFAERLEVTEHDLKTWLVLHAENSVSELVLVTLLRDSADEIEDHELIPRSWMTIQTNDVLLLPGLRQ